MSNKEALERAVCNLRIAMDDVADEYHKETGDSISKFNVQFYDVSKEVGSAAARVYMVPVDIETFGGVEHGN